MRYAVFLAVGLLLFAGPASAQQAGDVLAAAANEFGSGKLKEAAEKYEQVVKEQPAFPEARVGLIRTYLAMNDVLKAVSASREATTALPQSASVTAALGDVLFRLGKISEASQAYRHALNADANVARAWWGMGRIQSLTRMGKEARNSFIKAYQLDRRDPDIVRDWAYTHDKPGEVAAALEEHVNLSAYRGSAYLADRRGEIATLQYLGDRKPCELISARTKTTLRFELRNTTVLNIGGAGSVELPRPLEQRIKLSINGKGGDFHFDISNSNLRLYEDAAKRLGVVRIADGPPGFYWGFAERVNFGNLEFRNCIVEVRSLEGILKTLLDHDGTVGLQIFSEFLLTMNPKKQTLVLDPLSRLPADETERWTDAKVGADRKDFTQMFPLGNTWLLFATPRGKTPMLFALSSASNVSSVSTEIAKNVLNISTTARPLPLGGCTQNCVSLEVGGRNERAALLARDHAAINGVLGIESAGQLGSDFWTQFVLTID